MDIYIHTNMHADIPSDIYDRSYICFMALACTHKRITFIKRCAFVSVYKVPCIDVITFPTKKKVFIRWGRWLFYIYFREDIHTNDGKEARWRKEVANAIKKPSFIIMHGVVIIFFLRLVLYHNKKFFSEFAMKLLSKKMSQTA